MGQYVFTQGAIQVDIETVAGTYQVPTTTIPIQKDAGYFNPTTNQVEFNKMSAFHGSNETLTVTQHAGLEFTLTTWLPSDHTVLAPLMNAANIIGTADTGFVSYAYDTSSNATTTLSILQTTLRKTVSGYGGKSGFTLTAEADNPVTVSFDMKAQYNTETVLASGAADNTIPEASIPEAVFMIKDSAEYLINGNAAHFEKIELNLNTNVIQPKDTCGSICYVENIMPKLTVTINQTKDNVGAFSEIVNATEVSLIIPLFDAAGTKKYDIIIPKAVPIGQTPSDAEGRMQLERTYELRQTAGDDAFEIKAYTA